MAFDNHFVFLSLGARSESAGQSLVNRIALKAESISVTTNKVAPTFPIPGSGFISGESEVLGLDLGMATKSISLSGVLTSQNIFKSFDPQMVTTTLDSDINNSTTTIPLTDSEGFVVDDTGSGLIRIGSEEISFTTNNSGSPDTLTGGARARNSTAAAAHSSGTKVFLLSEKTVSKVMNAQEVAQLIHSFVDSSTFQKHQNFDELHILYPSKVDNKYNYRSGSTAVSDTSLDTLVPFNYKVREYDDKGNLAKKIGLGSDFPSSSADSGMSGLVKSFNTTFVGGSPFVEFTLEFEIARVIG